MNLPSKQAEETLRALDEEQRAAVLAPIGPLRIIAGAGTGKTRTLIHRIAYWHYVGVAPANKVLAVTFTRKSAGELRKRLLELGIPGVNAQTFHSAALSQLKKYWFIGGQKSEFPELLEGLQRYKTLRNSIVQTLRHLDRGKVEKRKVDSVIHRLVDAEITLMRSRMVSAKQYLEDVQFAPPNANISKEDFLQIVEHYEREKKSRNQIDYADVLERCVKMIENVPHIASEIRSTYEHFLVDEYQDNDLVQERLLAAWLGGRQSICVVGDPRQTIFSFKGADPSILADFSKKFPKAVTVELNQNYRSTPQVIDWANRLMRNTTASGGAKSELVSQGATGEKPELLAYSSERDEFAGLAVRIKKLKERENLNYADIAVLIRLNTDAATIRTFLFQGGVPSKTPRDQFWRDAEPVLKGLKTLAADGSELSGEQALESVLQGLNWLGNANQNEEMDDEHGDMGAALMALASSLSDSQKVDASSLLIAFAEQEDVGRDDEERDAVTVTTFHQAKGLEWEAVFMPRFVSGVLPISHAKTIEKVDEERRMAYVGITRARKFLELSWAETYKYLDQTRSQNLSPFEAHLRSIEPLKPLPAPPQTKVVTSIRSGTSWGFQPPEKSGSVPFDPLIGCTFVEGSQIAVGVRISHPDHGLGRIDTVKNSYTIAEFDNGRRFKVKFA
jgi:DNA helicase-2/ATP-dependent DNA helicase PcrA